MILLFLVATLLAVWYLYQRIRHRRKFALASAFPGPTAYPFIGSIWRIMGVPPEQIMQCMRDMAREYGGIFRIWVGMHKVAFVVSEARYAELVLRHSHKYLAKSDLYGLLSGWLGDGLLLSTGQKWRNRRKAITPAFHFRILEQFEEIFEQQGAVLVERLGTVAGTGAVVNVYEYVSLLGLDNICEAAMGTKINAQLNAKSAYVQAVHEMSKIISLRINKIWARSAFLLALFARELKQRQDAALKTLHDFTRTVIRKRREQLLASATAEEGDDALDAAQEDEDGVKRKLALLDVLLRASIDGKPLSNADIQEEVDTFMFEGHDTTTSAISFALHLLSRHKDVQDKVYAEIVGELEEGCSIKGKLPNLKYMELVIKESLRLYPPVPFMARELEEDLQIDEHRTIPAHCNFSIDLVLMFRDPNVFERPDDFWPERFAKGAQPTLDAAGPYAYCPFSAGTRNCIGQKFAMLEMKSTLAQVLRAFEVLPGGPAPIVVNELILRSANGMQMRLERRAAASRGSE